VRRPGTRLRTLASRVCSAKTMERLVDPVIGDLQAEYAEAIRDGRTWRSRGALIVGYVAFVKVFLLCGLYGVIRAWHDWNTDDQRNLQRVFWLTAVVTLLVATFIEMPGLIRLPDFVEVNPEARTSLLVAYLIPAALASSVPVGILLGTTFALSGRALSRRLLGTVLLVAIVVSAIAFVNLGWVTPAANQSFREELVGGLVPRPIPRGERELTVLELRSGTEELRRWYKLNPDEGIARARALYHQRLSLAAAPLTFFLLAIVLATRRRLGRPAAAIAACLATPIIVFVLMLGRDLSYYGRLPPHVGPWLFHVLVLTASIVLAAATRARTGPPEGGPYVRVTRTRA
jgi:hypothetical protein